MRDQKLQDLFSALLNKVEITDEAVKFFNVALIDKLVGQPALDIWNSYHKEIAPQDNTHPFDPDKVSGLVSQLNGLVRSQSGDWLPHYFRARILFEDKLNFPRRFVLASYQEFSAFLDALTKQLFVQLCSKPLVPAEFEPLKTFIIGLIEPSRLPVMECNLAAVRDLPYCLESLSPTARMRVLVKLHKKLGIEAKRKLLLLGYIEMLYFFKLNLLEDANEHFRILSQRQEFGEILDHKERIALNTAITKYVTGCKSQEEDESLIGDEAALAALMESDRNRKKARALLFLPREPLESIEEEQFFDFGMSWCQVWPHPVEVDPTVNEKGDEFILYRKTVEGVNQVHLLMRYDRDEVGCINLTEVLNSQGRIELLEEINWPKDGRKRVFGQLRGELGDELCRLVYQHCSAYHVKQGGLKGYRFFFLSGKPDSVGFSFDELSCALYQDDDRTWKISTYHFEGSTEVLRLKPEVLSDDNVKDFLSQLVSFGYPSNVKLRVAFPKPLVKFLGKFLYRRPPEGYICSISLRVMRDPVTVDDFDCEKKAFEWLKENALKNRRCRLIIPNTDEEVSVNGSVNNDLRKAIAEYRKSVRNPASAPAIRVQTQSNRRLPPSEGRRPFFCGLSGDHDDDSTDDDTNYTSKTYRIITLEKKHFYSVFDFLRWREIPSIASSEDYKKRAKKITESNCLQPEFQPRYYGHVDPLELNSSLWFRHLPNSLDDEHCGKYFVGKQISGAFSPLLKMGRGVQETFYGYSNHYQRFKDLAKGFFGLFNFFTGVISVVAGVAGILPLAVYVMLTSLSDTQLGSAAAKKETGKIGVVILFSWCLWGLCNMLHGVLQAAFWPIAILRLVFIRSCCEPFDKNSSRLEELRQGVRHFISVNRKVNASEKEHVLTLLYEYTRLSEKNGSEKNKTRREKFSIFYKNYLNNMKDQEKEDKFKEEAKACLNPKKTVEKRTCGK